MLFQNSSRMVLFPSYYYIIPIFFRHEKSLAWRIIAKLKKLSRFKIVHVRQHANRSRTPSRQFHSKASKFEPHWKLIHCSVSAIQIINYFQSSLRFKTFERLYRKSFGQKNIWAVRSGAVSNIFFVSNNFSFKKYFVSYFQQQSLI